MANTLSIDQVSSILREVVKLSTGQEVSEAVDTSGLITIGQKSLANGYDPVMNAITQVISRTIFSNRPYTRKFGALMMEPERWGNIVRKIAILETPNDVEDNPYVSLTDGESIDQYKVSKPKSLELRFIGQQTYEVVKTIFDTQLDTAFSSASEFGAFISMVFQYVFNKIEKIHEETARATVCAMIAGKIAGDTSNVVHLVTEYNAATGSQLTSETVYSPENFGNFMKWAYSRINTVSNLMTEYSIKFHTNLTDGVIMRHTPKEFQRAYFYAPVLTQMTDRVLSDTYHDTILKLPGAEMVNFWQDIDSPDKINLPSPNYLGADGSIKTGSQVNVGNVFGIIFDKEAMGYSPILTRTPSSPYNAKGEYRNQYWKINERHFVDFTENAVVFLLD